MLTSKTKVLILAGKRNQDSLSESFGVQNKALIPLAGKRMVEWVFDAINGFGTENLWISVDAAQKALFEQEFPAYSNNLLIIENSGSPMNSIIRALNLLKEGESLLVTTADNPLLNSEFIHYFLQKANESEAELLIATVNGHEGLISKYPFLSRTWHKLNSKVWLSGANLFYWSPKTLNSAATQILTKLEERRKSPMGFASILSGTNLIFLLKLILQCTSIKEANQAFSKTLAFGVEFITLPFPEACVDVDKLSDYEFVERLLNSNNAQICLPEGLNTQAVAT